ncbi:MAG: DUF4350 domain-containing protein [Terriglobales bacterium]
MSTTDRKFLIAGAVVLTLIVTAVVLLAPDQDLEDRFPSTYSTRSGGAKATYLLLQGLGYNVERWNAPLKQLPEDTQGVLLVFLSPQGVLPKEERESLQRFLTSGGTLLASGARASEFITDLDAFPTNLQKQSWTHFPVGAPSGLNRGMTEITMPERSRVWNLHEGQIPVFANPSGPAVLEFRQGKGKIIWLESPAPLTNAGMKLPQNVTFLVNCLNTVDAKRILWDTYYSEDRRTLASTLSTPVLYWGFAQLLLVVIAALWTFSRRSGPMRAAPEISRLSPLELVDTLGGLYRRSHASSLAIDVAFRRFTTLMTRRLGLRSNSTPQRIAESAAPFLRREEPALAQLLQECDSARFNPELKANQAVRLVRELHDILIQMKLIPAAPQENR